MNSFTAVVVVSKGFNGASAIRYNHTNEGTLACNFKAAERVKNGYNNWNFEAYGAVAEKIQTLKVDAGSNVSIIGTMNQKEYDDPKVSGSKKINYVCNIFDISFTNTYNVKRTNDSGEDEGADVESTTIPQNQSAITQDTVNSNKPVDLSELAKKKEKEQFQENNVNQQNMKKVEIKQVNLDQDQKFKTLPDDEFFN